MADDGSAQSTSVWPPPKFVALRRALGARTPW